MLKRITMAAIGAAIALSVGAAGAYFTTQVQVADSVIRAGAVSLSTEPTSAPLSIESLAPGTEVDKSLAVVNDGSLAADVVVTAVKKAGVTDLWEALTCQVTYGSRTIYAGPLAQMRTEAVRLPAGARGDLRFAVGLPATAGNDLANDYVKTSLYVDAEQAH